VDEAASDFDFRAGLGYTTWRVKESPAYPLRIAGEVRSGEIDNRATDPARVQGERLA
jgi:hypothetical protein